MGGVKVVRLRGTSNELLATAWKVGGVGRKGRCRQWLLCIMCLWAEFPGMTFIPDLLEDHKSTLGKVCEPVDDSSNFLARLAVFAFLQIP